MTRDIRRWIALCETKGPSTVQEAARLTEAQRWRTPSILYHCTLSRKVSDIFEHGLDPKRSRTDAYQSIFLAADLWQAENYANAHHFGEEGPFTILAVKLSALDKSLLEPDGDDLPDMLWDMGIHDRGAWKRYSWRQSLRIAGQCSYAGVIPASAISVVKQIGSSTVQEAARPLRDVEIPVPAGVFTRLGIPPGKVFADCTALMRKHTEYFTTPEQVRLHVEEVMQRPDFIFPANQPDHRLIVRRCGHRAVVLEVVFRGGRYRVRSAYVPTDAQLQTLRNKQGG